jgi:hypothetical protein
MKAGKSAVFNLGQAMAQLCGSGYGMGTTGTDCESRNGKEEAAGAFEASKDLPLYTGGLAVD